MKTFLFALSVLLASPLALAGPEDNPNWEQHLDNIAPIPRLDDLYAPTPSGPSGIRCQALDRAGRRYGGYGTRVGQAVSNAVASCKKTSRAGGCAFKKGTCFRR